MVNGCLEQSHRRRTQTTCGKDSALVVEQFGVGLGGIVAARTKPRIADADKLPPPLSTYWSKGALRLTSLRRYAWMALP